MAKRLTPFIGLAVVAALALAAAFGAFSLNPAFAGDEGPNARGLAQPVDFQAQTALAVPADPTIETVGATTTDRTDLIPGTNRPGNMRVAKGDTFTIDAATAVLYSADPEVEANKLDRYYVNVQRNGVLDLGLDADGDPIVGTVVQASASTTEVTITARAPGQATVTILSEDIASNATFVAGTGRTPHSTYTFNVVVLENDLELSSLNPRSNARYDVSFISPVDLVAGVGEITIELEDFGFPGSTLPGAVGISSDAYYNNENDNRQPLAANTTARYNTDGTLIPVAASYQGGLITPTDVRVSGEEITISVPDMNPENDRGDNIMRGDLVNILIRQGSGLSNPSEGGNYSGVITNNVNDVELTTDAETVPRLVELDETDGGRGTVVKATGKGFKNGTSLGFFRDTNSNGRRDPGEVTLCDVAQVGSDDTGSCSFTVSNPPFTVGNNYVGAVDGRGQNANKAADNQHDDQTFELTPTISASPASGNPGDTILVQMYDFPPGETVDLVDLARQVANDADTPNTVSHNATSTGTDGSANFRMTVPNWAPEGVLDLQVTAGGKKDNITITIGGPVVKSTPTTVLANQRINLVGTGFTPNTRVCCGPDRGEADVADPTITIGGDSIEDERVNDGADVRVDNGGNWSASIDLPLNQVTSDEGVREILVRDSGGRSGSVDVTVPTRSVTIDPPVGRGGTVAVVRGENFPSKNDSGDSFNVEITYTSSAGELRVSTVPDASGRFEAEITVPRLATIPSTNTVQVVYEYGDNDIPVTTTVTHQVPEGELSLSQSSGPPGTVVTVRGEGFRSSTPVTSVEIGDIEIPLNPAPYTTRQGGLEFDIRIPDLDTGVQTIEVQISGGTTASIGFTVTPGEVAGAETPVAEAVANMGDNLVRVFNFNNDTKTWTFYDPEAGDASTMAHFIAGASYWVLVGQTQEVILNRETRTLTCANDSCWNLIVW